MIRELLFYAFLASVIVVFVLFGCSLKEPDR